MQVDAIPLKKYNSGRYVQDLHADRESGLIPWQCPLKIEINLLSFDTTRLLLLCNDYSSKSSLYHLFPLHSTLIEIARGSIFHHKGSSWLLVHKVIEASRICTLTGFDQRLSSDRRLAIKWKLIVFSLESSVKRNLLGLELLQMLVRVTFQTPWKKIYHGNSGSLI